MGRGGEMLPLPTKDLRVSGTKRTKKMAQSPEPMHMNQKMARQPSLSARTPPSTGPTHGPSIGPMDIRDMKPARSLGRAMSATTPAPTIINIVRYRRIDGDGKRDVLNATVLADPAACTHLSRASNQYALVGVSARPTQERERMRRQAMSIGLRPYKSETVPHSIGAVVDVSVQCFGENERWDVPIACRTMYSVTVRLMSSTDL